MTKQGKFMVFCAKQYKAAKNLTGKQLSELFTKYRVWEYVYTCYEALHTTGINSFFQDVDLYIEARQPVMSEDQQPNRVKSDFEGMTSMRKPQKSCIALAISFVMVLLCLTACSASKNEMIFTEQVNDQYASIVWNDKEYVPFCAITSSKDTGAYLGYMEGDKGMKVYHYRDYSNEEWIIQSGYGCAMLYREINVENIPNGLTSAYEWNH